MTRAWPDVRKWLQSNEPTGRGMCLNTSQRSYAARPMGASDATAAIPLTKDLQRSHDISAIPAGAHILYSGGSNGHGHSVVADGGGYCWTVDWRPGLNITRVRISDMESAWDNLRWGGWSKFYGDQPLDVVGDAPAPKPPTPAKDDDVPDYFSSATSNDLALSAGDWKSLRISDDADYSIAFGPCHFSAFVQVTASGLADGESLDVRFYQVDTKEGAEPKRVSDYRAQKLWGPGLAGGVVQLGQLKRPASGWSRRLRVEALTRKTGVVVTSTEARAFSWKS